MGTPCGAATRRRSVGSTNQSAQGALSGQLSGTEDVRGEEVRRRWARNRNSPVSSSPEAPGAGGADVAAPVREPVRGPFPPVADLPGGARPG